MSFNILTDQRQELEQVLMIGDKVLIRPKAPMEKTTSGLYLPPGVQQKDKIHSGYILKIGPGYPIPNIQDSEETWKPAAESVKYLPLQVQQGDLAVYLQKNAFKVHLNKEELIIIPQAAVLMVLRDEKLFD